MCNGMITISFLGYKNAYLQTNKQTNNLLFSPCSSLYGTYFIQMHLLYRLKLFLCSLQCEEIFVLMLTLYKFSCVCVCVCVCV